MQAGAGYDINGTGDLGQTHWSGAVGQLQRIDAARRTAGTPFDPEIYSLLSQRRLRLRFHLFAWSSDPLIGFLLSRVYGTVFAQVEPRATRQDFHLWLSILPRREVQQIRGTEACRHSASSRNSDMIERFPLSGIAGSGFVRLRR